MTIRDINDIINAVCPNDEDYEKPCISPKYLRQELEKLALDQEQYYLEYLESNCLEIPTGSTTKNDLAHCHHTDAEIAKSFIEDVEAVKEQLPCGEQMDFPNTFDEFAEDYGFKDKDEVYTNGIELIPVYRVKQWLEHISTTKNVLVVDCISRADVRSLICKMDRKYMFGMSGKAFQDLYKGIDELPSVTPQLSSELEKNSKKLEKNFGELDCISRADAIKAMQDKAKKLTNEDTINGLCGAVAILFDLPSVTPQKPKCKNCKWWKDSDGEYRRGCGAESKCPINRREVFEGNGYCYMFEPQESEEEK